MSVEVLNGHTLLSEGSAVQVAHPDTSRHTESTAHAHMAPTLFDPKHIAVACRKAMK